MKRILYTVIVTVAFVVPLTTYALTEGQIQSILTLLSSFGTEASVVENVNKALRGQPTTTPTPGTVAPQACKALNLTQNLFIGKSDSETSGEVSRLQEFLRSTGDYVYPRITGYFGPSTEEAVQSWQRRNGVVSSGSAETTGYGLVGPQTRSALRTKCGEKTSDNENNTPSSQITTDLKINNSDSSLTLGGEYATFTWNSSVADYCDASGSTYWNGRKSTKGTESIWVGNEKTSSITYTITCSVSSGKLPSRSDSVTVYSSSSASKSIEITNPGANASTSIGNTLTFKWRTVNASLSESVYIDLIGSRVSYRITTTQNSGEYVWRSVGTAAGGISVSAGTYSFRVCLENDRLCDSEGPLTIKDSATQSQTINILSPNGGEVFSNGDAVVMKWSEQGNMDNLLLDIYLLNKNNGFEHYVATNLKPGSSGQYTWVIPSNFVSAGTSAAYKVELRLKNSNGSVLDYSTGELFSIEGSQETIDGTLGITVTSPNGGETWYRQETYPITWSHSGDSTSEVDLYLLDANGSRTLTIKTDLGYTQKSYNWEVAKILADGNYFIEARVCEKVTGCTSDRSNNIFYVRTKDTPASYSVGDVSQDGSVGAYDAALVEQHVDGTNRLHTSAQSLADVNGDGKITKLDSRIILAYTVGNVSSLPDTSLRYGDVSFNGVVSSYDAALIEQHIEGSSTLSAKAQLVADVNDDGSINSTDVNLILDYSVGNIQSFPVSLHGSGAQNLATPGAQRGILDAIRAILRNL